MKAQECKLQKSDICNQIERQGLIVYTSMLYI